MMMAAAAVPSNGLCSASLIAVGKQATKDGWMHRAQADRSVWPGTQPKKKRSESSQACEDQIGS